jgi:hypothetical protein
MENDEFDADFYLDLYRRLGQFYFDLLGLGPFYFGLGYLYFGLFLGIPPMGGGIRGGYSLWRYAEGKWVLQKDACEPGYESSPPQESGSFEGEFRRTAARPRRQP